jgi:hypothetical protein
MHANDNAKLVILVEEERPGRLVGVRAPLPDPPMYICTAPGEELTPAEREAVERFLAHQRRRERAAGRRRAA